MTTGLTDHDILFKYVEEVFINSRKTEWPTVRQCAKDLKWTMRRVMEAVDGDPEGRLFTSSYGCGPAQLKDTFVESILNCY